MIYGVIACAAFSWFTDCHRSWSIVWFWLLVLDTVIWYYVINVQLTLGPLVVYLGVPGYSMVWWERFYTNVYIGWPRCLGSVVRCLPTLPTGGTPLSSIIGFELFCIMLCVWILLCNIWFPESVSWLELDGTAWTWQTVLHSRAFFCHNGPFLSYGPNLYTHFAISHFLYM